MQIQYRETKTGFECVHVPSIDMSSVQPTAPLQSPGLSHKRSIVKKASKLSFGMKRDKGKDKELPPDKDKEKEKEAPGRPSGGTTLTTTPSSGSSSFFNVSSNNHTIHADHANGANGPSTDATEIPGSRPSTIGKGKMLPPIPRDSTNRAPSPLHSLNQAPTGEADAFENLGNNKLGVRFEINIVKVSFLPRVLRKRLLMFYIIKVQWLPLNGIQFRRASGDGWQYQMLARRVLTELKL